MLIDLEKNYTKVLKEDLEKKQVWIAYRAEHVQEILRFFHLQLDCIKDLHWTLTPLP